MPELPETQTAILDAAEARFAAKGFAATPIKEIAADAEVNSAMLYYYYAGKEALYAAVVSRLLGKLAAEMGRALESAASPEDAIRVFAERQGEVFAGNPHMIKVIGRELIDHDAAHAQDAIRHLAATTFERLHRLVKAGQRAGIFRTDFDPRYVAISIVAQTAYFHFARPAVEILLNDGRALPRRTNAAFAAHVANFTLAALAPHKTSARKKSVRHQPHKTGIAS